VHVVQQSKLIVYDILQEDIMGKFFCLDGCPPNLEEYRSDPRVLLQHLWVLSLLLVILMIIFSIWVAIMYSDETDGNQGKGFAAVWAALMSTVLAIYTYKVLSVWRLVMA